MGNATNSRQSDIRIGIFYDGIFWQRFFDYRRYNHPEPKLIDMEGVHDAIRWYACSVFSCPVDRVTVVDARFIWTQGYRKRALLETLDHLNIKLYQVPFNTKTQRAVGFVLELGLTCYEVAYADPQLDLVALIAGSDDYLPLIERMIEDGISVLVPRINVDYKHDNSDKKRFLATSSHLTDAVTHAPSWDELLNVSDDYPLTPPLHDDPFVSNRKPGRNRMKFRS
jgi:hypothetical protein